MWNAEKYPPNWEELKLAVRERDNYTCQHCGCKHKELRTSQTGKVYEAQLHVAHLDHDKENWEVTLDRLLLLCQSCHLKYDRESNLIKFKSTLTSNIKKPKKKEDCNWKTPNAHLRCLLGKSNKQIERMVKQGSVPPDSFVISTIDVQKGLREKLTTLGLERNHKILALAMEIRNLMREEFKDCEGCNINKHNV